MTAGMVVQVFPKAACANRRPACLTGIFRNQVGKLGPRRTSDGLIRRLGALSLTSSLPPLHRLWRRSSQAPTRLETRTSRPALCTTHQGPRASLAGAKRPAVSRGRAIPRQGACYSCSAARRGADQRSIARPAHCSLRRLLLLWTILDHGGLCATAPATPKRRRLSSRRHTQCGSCLVPSQACSRQRGVVGPGPISAGAHRGSL